MSKDIARSIRQAANELSSATSDQSDLIGRHSLEGDLADSISSHCTHLEIISGSLNEIASELGTSEATIDPSRAISFVRHLRNSPNMARREIDLALDQIDSLLHGHNV